MVSLSSPTLKAIIVGAGGSTDLLATMRAQRHGKFNEAVVAVMWYERHLPRGHADRVYMEERIEAFLTAL